MDQKLLSKMVGELVLDHNAVALPGLGMFVVEDIPASFVDKGYTITPPYRQLSFRQGCKDGSLLVEYYSETNHISQDAARAILTDYISQLKEILFQRRTVSFPGLGRLRVANDGRFLFIPDENLDIFPDGIALEPISLKTHVETAEDINITVSNLSDILARDIAENQETAETSQADENPDENPDDVPTDVPADDAASSDTSQPNAPDSAPEAAEEEGDDGEVDAPTRSRWWIHAIIILVAVAMVALCLFIILAQVAPDFIDSILYTPEELEIINS